MRTQENFRRCDRLKYARSTYEQQQQRDSIVETHVLIFRVSSFAGFTASEMLKIRDLFLSALIGASEVKIGPISGWEYDPYPGGTPWEGPYGKGRFVT